MGFPCSLFSLQPICLYSGNNVFASLDVWEDFVVVVLSRHFISRKCAFMCLRVSVDEN